MTTEEKNNAILNSGDDYEEILDIQYGKKGTPGRDAFDRDAEAFILAERLKQERINAGLTQEQLAARIGTKKSYISRIENGKTDVASKTARQTFSCPPSSKFFRASESGSASPSCKVSTVRHIRHTTVTD